VPTACGLQADGLPVRADIAYGCCAHRGGATRGPGIAHRQLPVGAPPRRDGAACRPS
ncbi:unnamed protein product, partial [Musa textilis]